MHLPELSLLSGAMRGFGSLEGLLVKVERKVEEDVLELAGADVIALDLWKHLFGVASAKRTLVVGELDQCDLRAGLTLEWLVRDADRVFREGVGDRPALQDSLDLLEVLLNGLLPLLESFDVSSQRVIGSRHLCQAERRGQERQNS